jgi:uracil-DNA glycosylase
MAPVRSASSASSRPLITTAGWRWRFMDTSDPVIGTIVGKCPGQGHEPFEVSKDVSERYARDLKESLPRYRRKGDTLLASEIETTIEFVQNHLARWKYQPEMLLPAGERARVVREAKQRTAMENKQARQEASAQRQAEAIRKQKERIAAYYA